MKLNRRSLRKMILKELDDVGFGTIPDSFEMYPDNRLTSSPAARPVDSIIANPVSPVMITQDGRITLTIAFPNMQEYTVSDVQLPRHVLEEIFETARDQS